MKRIIPGFSAPSNFLRKIIFILFDSVSFITSIIIAFSIIEVTSNHIHLSGEIYLILLVFLIIKLVIFSSFNLYNISWRHVSLQDVANIAKAAISAGHSSYRNQYVVRTLDPLNSWKQVGSDLVLSGSSDPGFSSFFVVNGYIYTYESYTNGYFRR